jgi:uncharacterized protein YjgD (DUF1641 family)
VASVSVMPAAQQPDPAQALAERLAEPRTAAAINTLLDHADLLALLVSGLDGLVSRGDTITDSLADGVSELLGSDLVDPKVIEIAALASRAVTTGAEQASRRDLRVTGVVGLARALRDPDVSRALGFALSIAKALGRELDQA